MGEERAEEVLARGAGVFGEAVELAGEGGHLVHDLVAEGVAGILAGGNGIGGAEELAGEVGDACEVGSGGRSGRTRGALGDGNSKLACGDRGLWGGVLRGEGEFDALGVAGAAGEKTGCNNESGSGFADIEGGGILRDDANRVGVFVFGDVDRAGPELVGGVDRGGGEEDRGEAEDGKFHFGSKGDKARGVAFNHDRRLEGFFEPVGGWRSVPSRRGEGGRRWE